MIRFKNKNVRPHFRFQDLALDKTNYHNLILLIKNKAKIKMSKFNNKEIPFL